MLAYAWLGPRAYCPRRPFPACPPGRAGVIPGHLAASQRSGSRLGLPCGQRSAGRVGLGLRRRGGGGVLRWTGFDRGPNWRLGLRVDADGCYLSRGTPRSTWSGGRYDWMRKVLATERGRLTYRKRKQTIEPVFGHTKRNSGVTHFNRRGRAKVRTEWRLVMMTQNLGKVYRHQLATTGA